MGAKHKIGEPLLVIGIGAEGHGDDGAGLAVVRSLRSAELPEFVSVIEFSGDGLTLMHLWERTERVILVDAVSAKAPAGTIYTIDLLRESLPLRWHTTTHSLSVSDAINLARTLGCLPASIVLYGIQGATFQAGHGLSSEVRQAVERVTAMIELDLIAELDLL